MIKSRRTDRVAAMDKQVTLIAHVTDYVKGIRMLGPTETVLSILTHLHKVGLAAHSCVRRLLIWAPAVFNILFQLATVATYETFTTIAISKRLALDFNLLFSSLSNLKLVTAPLVSNI